MTKKDEVFELFGTAADNLRQARKLSFKAAVLLEKIRKVNGHKQIVGEEFDFNALLAQPEILVPRNFVYNISRMDFAQGFEHLPYSRLVSLADVFSNVNLDDEDMKEWFSKAETLGPQDFKDEVAKATGKVDSQDCKHSFKDYKICSACGVKNKKQ